MHVWPKLCQTGAYSSALHSTHTPICLFPCLGLELNLKSRYFSPALFLFFFLFFFVRDNAALHESSGPLSVSFECGSNHQALDSPISPLSGCVNIPWAVAPTLWIDKHSWLEIFISNNGLDDGLKPAISVIYFIIIFLNFTFCSRGTGQLMCNNPQRPVLQVLQLQQVN